MNNKIRVLGIDPGLSETGWAVLESRKGTAARLVDSGVIRVKHALGTWFIHAIELSRNATLYILRPPEYVDEEGAVVFPEAPIKRVVDSPGAARRLGSHMVRAVRDANDALRVVMSFTPDPRFS